MIKTFRDPDTEGIFDGQPSPRLPGEIQERAREKLRMIHRAIRIEDLRQPPGNRLEALRGRRAGQWSVRINRQWRVVFEFRDGDAYEVEITDYH